MSDILKNFQKERKASVAGLLQAVRSGDVIGAVGSAGDVSRLLTGEGAAQYVRAFSIAADHDDFTGLKEATVGVVKFTTGIGGGIPLAVGSGIAAGVKRLRRG